MSCEKVSSAVTKFVLTLEVGFAVTLVGHRTNFLH